MPVMKQKNIILLGLGAALATAATIFFLKRNKNNQTEKPPKGAPQVKVENPGDQSEFASSPSESELG
jgi:LPXTG-motif cell wall-anchored protein